MTTTQRDGERLLGEMVQLVQDTYSETIEVGDERALARLEQAWHRSHRGASAGWLSARVGVRVFASALALALLVVGGTAVYRHTDRLTYEVMNGTIGPGGFVRPTATGTAILFSEGSEITLGESARTRVDGLTANGGRVVVESGTVQARIVPRKHARWTLEAGPYTIRVTGTAFKVHWSWTDELLDVQMQRGSVVVTGPLASTGVTLTAGMRLTVKPGSGLSIGGGVTTASADSRNPSHDPSHDPSQMTAGNAGSTNAMAMDEAREDAPTMEEPVANRASDSTAPSVPDSVSGPGERLRITGRQKAGSGQVHRGADRRVAALLPSDLAARQHQDWDKQLARGDVQGILADADARGLDRLLGSVSGRDLSALADAARYGHRPALARRALLTTRDRFPLSSEARDAAFFLGGLAEDAAGSAGQVPALDWYQRYLSESPRGRYVAQALGRKMIMKQKLNGSEAARSGAEEYLARFPDGPYAAAARKLMRAP